jgi:hypothetical protein
VLEWLTKGALPIGMLMFAGMFIALVLRRARARRAAHDFPVLAHQLGLELRPSPHRRSIGTLSGEFQGYRVFVDPDELRRITVRFEHEPGVDFRNYEQARGAPRAMRTFYSGDKRFDTFFKTRYADDAVAERLAEVPQPSRLLEPFRGRYYRELKQLNITSNGISCVLDFGNPPHIPADAVQLLLPAMVQLARIIEPHAGEG